MEEGKRQDPVSEHEINRFSSLLFGNKRQRQAPKEIEETKGPSNVIHKNDPKDQTRFQDIAEKTETPNKGYRKSVEQFLNGIDQQLLLKP